MALEVYEQIIDNHMREFKQNMIDHVDEYGVLSRAAEPLKRPMGPILGREKQLRDLRLGLRNPEKANVILLGEPGTGKSALVQGFAHNPQSTQYLALNVDIERLIANPDGDKDSEMATGLMDLVQQTIKYSKEHDLILVLFMDEFHRIAMESPAAVEAFKPILVQSAELGFRVIGATTFEEYDREIASNRALDQRLLRMDLPELQRDAIINVLKSRAKKHHAENLADPEIYGQIYDASRQYLPSNSQPRASLDILMSMVGDATIREYMRNGELIREYGTAEQLGIDDKYVLSRPMLNQVILSSYSIDIDNIVDVDSVKHAIRTKVFNQTQAIETIIARLEMSMEEFNDPTRPKVSFLSTGPTGTGKTELAKVITEAMHIPLKRFDMSGYSNPEDAQIFADQLAQAAWSAPNAYILIDEAEKSTRQCMNILLQVLDDARLTAKNNSRRVISFAGNIINLTTNLGSEVYQHKQRFDADNDWIDPQEIYKSLANNEKFETSVLGRIDVIAPFRALPKRAMASIANKELWANLNIRVTSQRPMFVSPDIIPYIVIDRTSNDSEQGGARDAKRNVKNLVVQKVAHYLTKRRPPTPLSIHLDQTPRFRDEHIGDPRAADVVVEECYSEDVMNQILLKMGQQLGHKLTNKGLFIPKTWTGQQIMLALNSAYKRGYVTFKTTVDITETIVIGGDENVDIRNNARLIK